MSDRDDRTVKQAMTRAKQPRAGTAPGSNASVEGPTAVNVYVIHNDGRSPGPISDQIVADRFTYTGTSPAYSRYEGACGRRMAQNCMGSRS